MKINIFKESVVGYKNIVKSSNSQDFCVYKECNDYTIVAIADGHSMEKFKYSDIGSKLACRVILNVVQTYLKKDLNKGKKLLIKDLENKKIYEIIKFQWRNLVYKDFYKKNFKAYKLNYMIYGTTVAFIVLFKENALFFNLGDATTLIKKNQDYVNVFKNNNFKIVNSLACDECDKKMQYKNLKIEKNEKIVVFTDGFINSFKSYNELKNELDTTFEILNKDIFHKFYLKKTYKNHLNDISKYGSYDDISIIYLQI